MSATTRLAGSAGLGTAPDPGPPGPADGRDGLRVEVSPPRLTRRAVAARAVGGLGLAGLVATLPYALHWAGPAYAIDYGVVIAMAVLGISVLGWIGEISLASVAQMGVGLVLVNLLQQHGVPFALILPLVAVASVPVSAVIGVFALRLRGVYFAIATLAFAHMAQKTFFETYLGINGSFGGTQSKPIVRPSVVASDEALYYLLLAAVVLVAGACWALNRSRLGTALTALRDSEMAFSVLGHRPGRYKMVTICLSGAITTVAGGLFGLLQLLVPSNYFHPGLAIVYFGFAVVGGLGSVGGAMAAGLVFGALPRYFETLSEGKFVAYDRFFVGLLVLILVIKAPGGLADIGRRLWRRIEGPAGERETDPGEGLSGGGGAAVPVPVPTAVLAPASREILAVSGMSIHFGGVSALDGVALTARTAEITGVIGPNGAGKTTLFNCLSGLLIPHSGTAAFDGQPLGGAPATRARRGLGRTFQTPRLFPNLTVGDNLVLGCRVADGAGRDYLFDPALRALPQPERAERISRLVGYSGDLALPAGSLPFGELRVVELARALCAAPSLLMLDEPASGLDLDQAAELIGLLRSLSDLGLAVLLIEHDMSVVMGVCDSITVLDFGQVIACGTPAEIQQDEAVIEAYLGRTA
jgi:ABC-type branched-subunit amino acid transport system ATPase component/ABC-type branched-subunit amino acid transport system permease subunit